MPDGTPPVSETGYRVTFPLHRSRALLCFGLPVTGDIAPHLAPEVQYNELSQPGEWRNFGLHTNQHRNLSCCCSHELPNLSQVAAR